jgi:hypothetical protein
MIKIKSRQTTEIVSENLYKRKFSHSTVLGGYRKLVNASDPTLRYLNVANNLLLLVVYSHTSYYSYFKYPAYTMQFPGLHNTE